MPKLDQRIPKMIWMFYLMTLVLLLTIACSSPAPPTALPIPITTALTTQTPYPTRLLKRAALSLHLVHKSRWSL